MGRKGGGSVYSQPGIRVDGNSRHDTEEGFQVSKREVQGTRVGISKQKGITVETPKIVIGSNFEAS
jgi:hypothetical protein